MRSIPALAALLVLALPPTAAAPPVVTVAHRATAEPAPVLDEPAATAAMRAAGCPYATWADDGRQFLEFDRARGTAVEAVGDLAHATRIAVLVPGVDTTLPDFDRGLGGVVRRAPAWQARSLETEASLEAPDARVAVVAWLGYRTPAGISLDAIGENRARAGANALVAFVDALTGRYPGARVTLVGHSYGAIVAGLAAPRLPQVHDLVTLGAPGVGVDRAAGLGGAHVYAALAPTDWINRVPQLRLFGLGHGKRPSSPGFGAVELPTRGVAGHDWYLAPGSATLPAVADVVLDRPRPALGALS